MLYFIYTLPDGEGSGNPLQYSCLETPVDGGAWLGTVHGVTKESDSTEQMAHTAWLKCQPHSVTLLKCNIHPEIQLYENLIEEPKLLSATRRL